MLRVGLTGGIASGKSRVRAGLAAAGLHTLDLDRLAHEVMAPGGRAYQAVVAAFGREILAGDASIDRQALGARVFADESERRLLESLVHPVLREEEERRAAAVDAEPGAIFVTDAALLVEAGLHLRFDRLVVAHCGAEEQLRRLMARDGMSEAGARARLAAQMPPEEKRSFAHLVVDTSGTLDDTDRRSEALVATLRDLARRPPIRVAVPLDRALGGLLGALPPREGPSSLDVLRALARDGMEMPSLAALKRPVAVPWYRPRPPGPGEAPPAELALPVVLWALARRGEDVRFLTGALLSLARGLDPRPGAAATTTLAGLAMAEVARTGVWPEPSAPVLEAWVAEASRCANESPSPEAWHALQAMPKVPDPGGVVAILSGLLAGRSAAGSPPEAVDALARLG
jgi:dephospho-CoA kinase